VNSAFVGATITHPSWVTESDDDVPIQLYLIKKRFEEKTMSEALIFLPDISGFTKFIQSTEISHSQHIISELLELLIGANKIGLELAEIEGDALFFYKEAPLPSSEALQEQIDHMMTVFYSQLDLLKKNRICPCQACVSAPDLDLKIVAHYGPVEYITVQKKRKPFGSTVIQSHRLMKNSIPSDHYVLLSQSLLERLDSFDGSAFKAGSDQYDGEDLAYRYKIIEPKSLTLLPNPAAKELVFDYAPSLVLDMNFPASAADVLENLTNYSLRPNWSDVPAEFNPNEVTRLGTEHFCIINDKHFKFEAVTKKDASGELLYGESSKVAPIVDMTYIFYSIDDIDDKNSALQLEIYFETNSLLGACVKPFLSLLMKGTFVKGLKRLQNHLLNVRENRTQDESSSVP